MKVKFIILILFALVSHLNANTTVHENPLTFQKVTN